MDRRHGLTCKRVIGSIEGDVGFTRLERLHTEGEGPREVLKDGEGPTHPEELRQSEFRSAKPLIKGLKFGRKKSIVDFRGGEVDQSKTGPTDAK